MRLLLLLLVLVFTLVQGSQNFVDNRSGNIVIKPTTEEKNSQLFLKGSVFNKVSLKNINDVQVSNIITHVMGLLPLNEDIDHTGFPKVSVFNKPKLNLFFSVDSVSKEDLVNSKLFNVESMINIEKTFKPQDSLAELTTVVTGVSPSTHGIVSSSWLNPANGRTVQAYEQSSQSNSANIAYLANQSFNGKSMIISSSASKKLASATGVHTGVSTLYKDAEIYTYSVRPSGAVAPVGNSKSSSQFSMTNNQVETVIYSKEFQQFVLPAGWKASFTGGVFTVTNDKGASYEINFDHHETGSFISELVSVFNIVKNIKSNAHFNALAKDSVPDFISFDFSAAANIRKSQGAHSVAFKFTLALIEKTIDSAISQLSGVYGDRVATEIVTLAPSYVFSHDEIEKIESIVEDETYEVSQTLPHIYIKPSHNAAHLCNQMKQALSGTHLEVECFTHSFVPSLFVNNIGDAPAANNGTGSSGEVDPAQALIDTENTNAIAAFQIFVFFPIVFALFIGAGVCFLAKISFDSQSDTLLYRSTQRQY